MKSLFLVSSAGGYGGAERSLELLVGALQQGIRLTIFAEHPLHVERLRGIIRAPSRLVILPAEGSEKVRRKSVAKLVWLAWRGRPEAVLANTQASTRLMARAARWWPRTLRTFFYVRDFQWVSFDEVFDRLPRAHVLIPSLAVMERANYLREHLPEDGRRGWSVVPDMAKRPAPAPVGIGTEDFADAPVLHLATVNRFKGHGHLIGAAARLKASGRELRIGSYGVTDGDDLRRDLNHQIADAGLADRFTLAPYVDNPEALLRACLCVVVCSVSHSGGPETFGRTIIEAWAHGKPVVAFAAGSVPHLIEHDVDGLLVVEGDDAALAEALWRIKTDAALRRRLGENGRAKVERRFELKRVAAQLVTVLTNRTGA